MIASTTSGRRFGPLARYLERGRSGQETGRVGWTAERNLGTRDPALAARLMQATANANPRVQLPVYHLSVSFDPNDPVTPEQIERVADRLLHTLGLEEHQAVLVAHQDRAHPHVHIMVNRVHPETLKAWERWRDRPVIERVLREEEQALGLRQVKGTLYRTPARGQESERSVAEPRVPDERTLETDAHLRERALAHLPDYRAAGSWDELEARLAEHGLRLARKGQGLVLTDGAHEVKASRVARDLSLKRLEARFGTPYLSEDRVLTASERQRLSPAVADIVDTLAAHERSQGRRGEHYRLSTALFAATAERDHLAQSLEEARTAARRFDRDLAAVYPDAEAARTRFDEIVGTKGQEAALWTLRDQPDQLGPLRTVDEKRALGLLIVADDSRARRGAVTAAQSAGDLFGARNRLAQETHEIAHAAEKGARDAFALLYRDPAKARAAVDEVVSRRGADAATRQLAERPDVFGSLAPDRTRADGQGRAISASEAAEVAAEAAREAIALQRGASAAMIQAYFDESIPRLTERVRALHLESLREPDARRAEHSLARAIARLTPAQHRELLNALSGPQRAMAARIREEVRELALGRDEMERE